MINDGNISNSNLPISETLETQTPSEEKTLENQTQPSHHDTPTFEHSVHSDVKIEEEKQEEQGDGEEKGVEEDEEEAECGFCLFMKGGRCKEAFTAWEKCVEDAEKNKEDIVDKCFQVTGLLKKCMDSHSDYYEPVLRAEKAMEEEAIAQGLEQEGASEAKT